jgi:hypothetical protein
MYIILYISCTMSGNLLSDNMMLWDNILSNNMLQNVATAEILMFWLTLNWYLLVRFVPTQPRPTSQDAKPRV